MPLFLLNGSGHQWGFAGGLRSPHHHAPQTQMPAGPAAASTAWINVSSRLGLRRPSFSCSIAPTSPSSTAIAHVGEACSDPWGWAACCVCEKGLSGGQTLPQLKPASALSLARFLRLHSPPEGTNVLWELLGMTCFELAPPLDCAEGKG